MVAVVAGHICIDMTPELRGPACIDPGRLAEVGPLALSTGGSVANTGRALARLGTPTRLVADVGDDELGALLVGMLDDPGLDTTGITRRAGGTTSYSVVVEPPEADRTFWHHVGANAHFDGTSVDLAGASILHVGYPPILPALARDAGAALAALLDRAGAEGVTTSVDMALLDAGSPLATIDWHALLATVLPEVGVFAPSVDDIASVLHRPAAGTTDEVAAVGRELVAAGAAVVLLKAGRHGLYLRTSSADRLAAAGRALAACASRWADRELWAPSLDVTVLGTTGAGDTAVAGLLHGLASSWNAEDALTLAAATAATRISTRDPLPPAADLLHGVGTTLRFLAFEADGWITTDSGLARGPYDMHHLNHEEHQPC